MRRLIAVFVLALLASSPAYGTSHWSGCLAEPTYRCLVDHAAAEAKQIPGRVPRAYATALVAGAQAVGGRADEARASAEEARLLGGIIFDDADYGLLVSQIVWARAWAGDLDIAGDMLGWTSDPYALALGYAALAEAQVHHGYPQDAERSMRWAMEEMKNVKENRGVLLPYLAISHGYVGDAEGVHRLIAESRKITDSDGIPYGRTLAVAAGAVAEAMIGHTEESDALLIEAEDRLKIIEDQTDIGVLASHMAWALAEAGDTEGARGVISQLAQLDLAPLTYQQRALIFSYAALALSRAQ
ncbi:MAG: hypothetical protein OEN55_17080 [Alphaproteobacteria bacterium]|nr:hypothetical protein [Alphaproteobacteria bacterium]